jgi:hypothetical protein
MAMTGYYRTMVRPRASRPLSMLKYDPVGTSFRFAFEWSVMGLGKKELGTREIIHDMIDGGWRRDGEGGAMCHAVLQRYLIFC